MTEIFSYSELLNRHINVMLGFIKKYNYDVYPDFDLFYNLQLLISITLLILKFKIIINRLFFIFTNENN